METIKQTCSKCGARTDYMDDLHCRNIFMAKIDKLLSLGDLETAKKLYFSTTFDTTWKEDFLKRKGLKFKNLVLGSKIEGENVQILKVKQDRVTHCYACKRLLDNSNDIECKKCGWIICSCGACGCGYEGQDFINSEIF